MESKLKKRSVKRIKGVGVNFKKNSIAIQSTETIVLIPKKQTKMKSMMEKS